MEWSVEANAAWFCSSLEWGYHGQGQADFFGPRPNSLFVWKVYALVFCCVSTESLGLDLSLQVCEKGYESGVWFLYHDLDSCTSIPGVFCRKAVDGLLGDVSLQAAVDSSEGSAHHVGNDVR